jgi:signal peptidase II
MRPSISFLIALLVILVDQGTKYLARNFISPFEAITVLPFFHLVSVRNTGAAFGMFRGLGNTPFIIIAALAIVIISVLITRGREDRLGFSLILGGAVGNLIDRIMFGSVTDFIDVFAGNYHWPAFNVADSSLTVGLIVLLIGSFMQARRGGRS